MFHGRNSLRIKVEAGAGIEPAHTGFADQCITTLLPRHKGLRQVTTKLGEVGGVSTRLAERYLEGRLNG
jgi:hypothetical protein